mgnify:FL=1
MGLIKAATGAAGGTLADQWKEFFYSDSLDNDTLMVRGKKRIDRRSSNTKGHDNVITNGSGIAVADGQCMMIVDQGKIVEVCAEPGEYTYDMSSEPSVFAAVLEKGSRRPFRRSGNDLRSAEIRRKIRECIILIPKKLRTINSARRIRYGSVW